MYFKKPKNYKPYIPKMLYDPITPTWGNDQKILELFKQGKTPIQISIETGDRLAFVKRVILRQERPEDFIIEPILPNIRKVRLPKEPKPKAERINGRPITPRLIKTCLICGATFESPRWKKDKYCGRLCYAKSVAKRYADKRTPEEMARRDERDKAYMKEYLKTYKAPTSQTPS